MEGSLSKGFNTIPEQFQISVNDLNLNGIHNVVSIPVHTIIGDDWRFADNDCPSSPLTMSLDDSTENSAGFNRRKMLLPSEV